MKNLVLLTKQTRNALINLRKGETKFGENIKLLPSLNNIYEDIQALDVDYVIFGVQEDVGVRANYGKKGCRKAWDVVLSSLLNTQSNGFINAKRILILGHLDYQDYINEIKELNNKKKQILRLRKIVDAIDKDVCYLVSTIVKAGKVPIIIGGGHNNAYGNIKGSALASNSKINVVNLDAHTDFRSEEGRHSGNGFSYAYAEGFLKRYFIFGLHENYTSNKILKTLNKIKDVKYNTFEAIEIQKKISFESELINAFNFIANTPFGIEVDCDAIENMPSSAMTPSGFSMNQARQFVHHFGSNKLATYLHICEAIPSKKSAVNVGKAISYLITDFIKAHGH